MSRIAKLVIQSNLPQLDRVFDYRIPQELQNQVRFGQRVFAPFGRSKKPVVGFIVDVVDSSDHQGKLSELESLVSEQVMLTPEVWKLVQELSARSAGTLGELLKLAIPAHMPRITEGYVPIESDYSSLPIQPEQVTAFPDGLRGSKIQQPTESIGLSYPAPSWCEEFADIAAGLLLQGESTIILVPNFRDHSLAMAALVRRGFGDFVADYSQEQSKGKRFQAFLRALEQKPQIIIGSRAAALAPAHNLGALLVFDESDPSYADPAAPFLHTRDVALIRQDLQGCRLLFSAYSRSADMQRLIELDYLRDLTQPFPLPKIVTSEPGLRVDSQAHRAIREGLDHGSVLVMVSSRGESVALYCKACDSAATCTNCQGPLWVDSAGKTRCRWCNSFQMNPRCSCGAAEFGTGRAGATRTAAELGKAFPNSRVVESTGADRISQVSPGRNLVVATAGAEPYVAGGYQAVVLLDARVLLSKQFLRSQEEAVRLWSNAVSKLASGGVAVLVGVSGKLAQRFALWSHRELAELELKQRRELNLPPAIRLGSVSGSAPLLILLKATLDEIPEVTAIGPAPQPRGEDWQLIFKYPYSIGIELAKVLKAETASISAGKKALSRSGRNTRSLRVRMNDAEII